jgi:hypothetical protein
MPRGSRFASRALAGALVLAGCAYGGNIRKMPVSTTGAGATATLRLWQGGNRTALTGELLTVEDTALTVLVKRADPPSVLIIRVRLEALILIQLDGTNFGRSGARPDARTLDRLRLMSRYPAGLSDDQWTVVLSHHGLEAVTPYGDPRRRR